MVAGEDLKAQATEAMKKVLTVGVGALFLTEEALRGLVSEFKLPKEILGSVLESANRTKGEFLKDLSSDVMNKIRDKIDVKALVQEVLNKNDIEFNIKMSFRQKSEGPKKSSESS